MSAGFQERADLARRMRDFGATLSAAEAFACLGSITHALGSLPSRMSDEHDCGEYVTAFNTATTFAVMGHVLARRLAALGTPCDNTAVEDLNMFMDTLVADVNAGPGGPS